MAVVWLKSGDGEKPSLKRSPSASDLSEAVAAKAGESFATSCCKILIPSRGIAANWLVQPGFRGESAFGDECSRGLINLGDRSKKPAAKSSTMKGAKALGSES